MANQHDTFWTQARIDELKTRWQAGETGLQIARQMHATSRNAIIGKAHRLGLDSRAAIAAKTASNGKAANIKRRRQRKTVHYVDGKVFIIAGEAGMAIEEPEVFAAPRRFIELREGDCRWPGREPAGPDLLCCAAPALEGYPYCARHCRLAYQAQIPRAPKAPRR